ncbi:TonB-dependent receptor [bacterium]|nr:TonB-dependent receptor [bacterium]
MVRLNRFVLIFVLLLFAVSVYAASTGKIIGRITDKEGNPLIGTNIVLEGTSLGAQTGVDGDFFILNIPPGTYTVRASMLGYNGVVYNNVQVSTDRTTKLSFDLEEKVMELGEEVVYIAKRPMIRKDMTDSRITRTSEDLKMMPVENVRDVIQLTAGTVGNNFRGGRDTEVSYIVDGVSMVDPMTGRYEGYIPQVSFSEVNVITGGQSVEYGNSLSGVVNQVTKDGGDRFEGSVFVRTNDMGEDEVFIGERDRMKDLQGVISGPIPFFDQLGAGDLSFLLSGQFYDTNGRFQNDDSTLSSFYGKLTYKITPRHKLTFNSAVSNSNYQYYGHLWSRTTNEDLLAQYRPTDNLGNLKPDYNFYARDENGNFLHDNDGNRIPWYNNNRVDTEDLNHNGVIDPGEDLNSNGFLDSEDLNNDYSLDSYNMLDHLPDYFGHTEQFSVKWNHTLNSRTFYEMSASYYKTLMKYNVNESFNEDSNGNGQLDLELSYSSFDEIPDDVLNSNYRAPNGEIIPFRDLLEAVIDDQNEVQYVWFDFNRNGVYEYEDLNGNEEWDWKKYGRGHDLFVDENNNGYIDASENGPKSEWLMWEDINFNSNSTDNDEFYTFGDGKTYYRLRWNDDYKETFTYKGSITSQVHRYHQIKSGIELQFMEIFDHDVDMASGGNVYGQNFKANPRLYGGWVEDKMEFEGMVINIGARLDIFDINWDNYPEDVTDPVTDTQSGGTVKNPVEVKEKYYWGPRLGVAFPITERDLLSFNYSRNFQIPILRYAYTNVNWDLSGAFPIIGNPNLEPERTTSYELTLRHQFMADLAMVATGFYKDVSGLVDTRQVFYDPRNWYGLYINLDYGNVRGFELSLEKRFSHFYSGSLSYTYSVAKGKASDARQNYENAWAENQIRTTESYLDWDQRNTIYGSVQFMVPKGTSPFGFDFFDEWLISLIGRYGSGLPFSSPAKSKEPPINDERLPYTLEFDGRIQKRFSFNDNFAMVAYLQGYNIFNHHNIDQRFFQVNADAGWYLENDSDNDGQPDKDVDGVYNDPRYWERGRYFQLGVGLEF